MNTYVFVYGKFPVRIYISVYVRIKSENQSVLCLLKLRFDDCILIAEGTGRVSVRDKYLS